MLHPVEVGPASVQLFRTERIGLFQVEALYRWHRRRTFCWWRTHEVPVRGFKCSWRRIIHVARPPVAGRRTLGRSMRAGLGPALRSDPLSMGLFAQTADSSHLRRPGDSRRTDHLVRIVVRGSGQCITGLVVLGFLLRRNYVDFDPIRLAFAEVDSAAIVVETGNSSRPVGSEGVRVSAGCRFQWTRVFDTHCSHGPQETGQPGRCASGPIGQWFGAALIVRRTDRRYVDWAERLSALA